MRMRGVVLGTTIGIVVGVGVARARRWWKTWGVDPVEAIKPLTGDDVVAAPIAIETRGITIDAPPSAVWPWLVQMGYGRAGWYSYDQLDQRGASSEAIVAGWQELAVGDIVPTHPTGGFEVAIVEPGRALVLRSDTALVQAQAVAARAAGAARGHGEPTDAGTVGIQASSAILGQTPQAFAASWAFVLEPVGERHTRLIERFRVWFGESNPGSRVIMPAVGFGVFVMMQRQMLGIRRRAERLATAAVPPVSTGEPLSPVGAIVADRPVASANGHRPAPEPGLVGAPR